MKLLSLLLFLLATGSAFAASTEPLFTPGAIALPPLNLRESTRAQTPRIEEAIRLAPSTPQIPLRPRDDRFVFPPAAGVDHRLKIARPDPYVEYHLRVIDPETVRRR